MTGASSSYRPRTVSRVFDFDSGLRGAASSLPTTLGYSCPGTRSVDELAP